MGLRDHAPLEFCRPFAGNGLGGRAIRSVPAGSRPDRGSTFGVDPGHNEVQGREGVDMMLPDVLLPLILLAAYLVFIWYLGPCDKMLPMCRCVRPLLSVLILMLWLVSGP